MCSLISFKFMQHGIFFRIFLLHSLRYHFIATSMHETATMNGIHLSASAHDSILLMTIQYRKCDVVAILRNIIPRYFLISIFGFYNTYGKQAGKKICFTRKNLNNFSLRIYHITSIVDTNCHPCFTD